MTDENRLQQLERMLEISRELTSTVSLEPLLHKIVQVAAELTGSEETSILLLNTRTGELRFRAASGDTTGRLRDIPVPVDDSIAGAVLLSGKPAIISDTLSDPRHYKVVGQRIGLETHSLLAVPLQIKDRRIGVLEAINKQGGGHFSQEDVETLNTLAAQAAVAIENARLVGDLRRAYEQLGELDRLKSDFIAIASHELRTPLGLILLYAAMLRDQMGATEGQQLDAVLRAAMRLRHIIETMLNLRYLETGEMELVLEGFDLRKEVQDACEDYEAIAESGGLKLTADLPDEDVSVLADREKVRVVLDNLISNAVKFTPSGGRVQVALSCQGDQVEITVTDTGVGIPSEELERVFDRFYQVEDHMTRRHGGMGLGLSIVRGLVRLHGGRVLAESVPGRGSRFVVWLPMTVPEESFFPLMSSDENGS
ncbi:MAG: GAF domain-containing sensor histidine kinase [Anaerolineae bacterium]|nr:GAF domain-containing sensor histidine kinase [Anaerolineae bacterium]